MSATKKITANNDEACLAELERLMSFHEELGLLLKKVESPILTRLAESWDSSILQLRQRLASPLSKTEYGAVKRGLRQGLRELPKLLKSLDGVDHSGLITLAEAASGFKISDF